jgi:VWFA-related protein
MVELEVVVRDNHGQPVPGLTKDDFIVYDSRKTRDITSFSINSSNAPVNAAVKEPAKPVMSQTDTQVPLVVSAPPPSAQKVPSGRSIALLFDDINTPIGDLMRSKIAATRFIKEASVSGDHIAIFTTSGSPFLNFTTDTPAILAAMTHMQSHPRTLPGGLAACPRMTTYEAYMIVMNDPTALKSKVSEACHCGGSPSCEVEYIPAFKFEGPPSNLPTSPYGGTALVGIVIDSVRAQAGQTWGLARVASQATLDAIKAVLTQLANQSGRRMLLLSSSGFLSGTLDDQLDAIINEAVRTGVVINTLDAKGLYAEAPGGPINETNELSEIPVSSTVFQIESLGDRLDSEDSAMARFAESTGGLLFRNNNDLDLGFYQLGVLPSITYLLGFPPAEDGEYHKIKLELKNSGGRIVLVRPGYFAPGGKAASVQPTSADKIDAEMRGSDEKTGVPATISEKFGASASGKPQLTIESHIDIQKLPFEQQKDRHVQKLTFVAALFDPQGNFITGKQAEMNLALKPESFERFSKTGINGVMQLEAPPGTYRLRMVVQEAVHRNMSATNKDVQIP